MSVERRCVAQTVRNLHSSGFCRDFAVSARPFQPGAVMVNSLTATDETGPRMRRTTRQAMVAFVALSAALVACGSSKASTPGAASTAASAGGSANPNATEQLPPGDIPDTQVFVAYAPAAGQYALMYPQGWAKRESSSTTTFTHDFNSIEVTATKAAPAPTIATARADAAAQLSSVPGFRLIKVDTVARSAGRAVRLVYSATSAIDAVTGKSVALEVERYLFWHNGTLVTITLSSPQGSDNVDPWKTVTNSLAWK
jgi:hypothetical protein